MGFLKSGVFLSFCLETFVSVCVNLDSCGTFLIFSSTIPFTFAFIFDTFCVRFFHLIFFIYHTTKHRFF